ncbi:hypothetical protein Ac2012v2_007592 [Leucoagaricus gongylophorus]
MNPIGVLPKALIFIADGTEEMEFTITYDILVRAGFNTTSAYVFGEQDGIFGTNSPVATCSRGMKIIPDVVFDSANPQQFGPDKYDLLVVPGGLKGARTMSTTSTGIPELTKEYLDKGKYVGLICAGSLVARSAQLARQPITSHPSVKSELETMFDYSENSIVVSGNLVTTRGPGTHSLLSP